MKRRGFLGLMGGAAVAGPGMAKAAIEDTFIRGVAGGGVNGIIGGAGSLVGQTFGGSGEHWAVGQLKQWVGRTPQQHAFHMARHGVHQLDPDLAGYRSFALHRKISLQRERDYWREYNGQKNWLQALVDGWLE